MFIFKLILITNGIVSHAVNPIAKKLFMRMSIQMNRGGNPRM